MRSTKARRLLLVGASLLSMVVIFGTSFFIGNTTTYAASGPLEPYQVGLSTLQHATAQFDAQTPRSNAGDHRQHTPCLTGQDTVPSFCGSFTAPGFGPNGITPQNTWEWQMLGNAPRRGEGDDSQTTIFRAPIIPVAVQGLNADGSVAFTYDPLQFVKPVLQSPIFTPAKFTSSREPTQFTDAVQRAEFFNQAPSDWHTLLAPRLEPEMTMKLPFGSYVAIANSDGTCCLAVLVDINVFQNLLAPANSPAVPADNTTLLGRAELSGEITTRDITSFLFPNTYLFFNGNPQECCVLGFHSIDEEPGTPYNGNRQRDYVYNYSSWISPGLFNGGLQDVTAYSHELAETFNDPLVTQFNNLDITPWYEVSGPDGLVCQDVLEVGDVVEVQANPTFPVTARNGVTYHPQTVALLQWFESSGTSNALDHAFSYPGANLTTSAAPDFNPQTDPANCGV